MNPHRRRKINTHNPLPHPDQGDYINLAPFRVREALEAFDSWEGKDRVPAKLKDLMLVLRVELDRNYDRNYNREQFVIIPKGLLTVPVTRKQGYSGC
jgi:hypothetical protein